MSNINNDFIEDFIRDIIPKKSIFIKKIEEYARKNHVPIIHPEVGELLKVLINIKGAKNILEIGCAIGYSSIIMAAQLKDGYVTTIERRTDMVKIAKENIEESGLENIKVLEGEAQKVLPELKDKFDFIFIDAAKGKYMEFLPYCIDMLKSGGVIVSDNVLFKGMVANDKLVVRRKKTIVKRMREYLDYISNHKDLMTSVIPIGDGVAISYKKEELKNE